jgi:ribosomal protein S8
MCSFQAEASGFLAGTCLLANLLKQPQIPSKHNRSIHTDSAILLARLQNATNQVSVRFWQTTYSDIVMQIVAVTKQVTYLERVYIKGHQDGKKKKADLTQPELFNIEANTAATEILYAMKKPASHIIPFPTSQANVYLQQQLISSSLNTLLHAQFSNHEYWEYLKTSLTGQLGHASSLHGTFTIRSCASNPQNSINNS